MADGSEVPDNSRGTHQDNAADEDSDTEDPVQPVFLDLGDDCGHATDSTRLGTYGAGASGSSEPPRREDNPFSFKHFIRSDVGAHRGARPKVYCGGRAVSSVSDLDFPQESKQTRIVPEYPSALPDFVQDHLVVEQCYLGNSTTAGFSLENLPDFAPSRDSNVNRVDVGSGQGVRANAPPQGGFPPDLHETTRNCLGNEVGASKSLPDFLADTQSSEGAPESPERETDSLRRELEMVRGKLSEQTRRVESLTRELEIARHKEHNYTQNLAKALEQVEKNLERSNMRTSSAENTIVKLRQEIKSLVSQLNCLKSENLALRGEEGASGGEDVYSPNDLPSQRLAQELRAAASTAEHSLRQLLTGVDNLRIMAASLENMHRIEEKRETFLDLDEDTGPAL